MKQTHQYYPRIRRAEGTAALVAEDLTRLADTIGDDLGAVPVECMTQYPAREMIDIQWRLRQSIASLADARSYMLDAARIAIGAPREEDEP